MHPTKRQRTAFAASLVAVALACTSCGGDTGADPESSPTPTSSLPSPTAATGSPARTPASAGTTITSASSDYGQVLWGPKQRVVYIWEREPTPTAECYGDCAEAWPPVLTTGEPVGAGGVDAALLGTTPRRDGSTQVTYNGHPLYYYAHEGPGEVLCHDITTHGGTWWVVTPAGDRAD